MTHQQLSSGLFLGFGFGRLAQLPDLFVQLLQDLQQIIAPALAPRSQFQVAQKLQAFLGPQLALLLESFVHGDVLQLVLDPRPHLHQRVPMLEQLPQIQLFHRGYPNRGKALVHQQFQNLRCVPLVGLLLARMAVMDRRRISDQQAVP